MKQMLIIDDEEQLAQVMKIKLEKAGYKCRVSYSSSGAIQTLKSEKFDGILLDMRIGGKSGADVVDDIRYDRKNLNYGTPIFVVSAFLEESLVKKLEPNVQAIFTKPVDYPKLLDKIKNATKWD